MMYYRVVALLATFPLLSGCCWFKKRSSCCTHEEPTAAVSPAADVRQNNNTKQRVSGPMQNPAWDTKEK